MGITLLRFRRGSWTALTRRGGCATVSQRTEVCVLSSEVELSDEAKRRIDVHGLVSGIVSAVEALASVHMYARLLAGRSDPRGFRIMPLPCEVAPDIRSEVESRLFAKMHCHGAWSFVTFRHEDRSAVLGQVTTLDWIELMRPYNMTPPAAIAAALEASRVQWEIVLRGAVKPSYTVLGIVELDDIEPDGVLVELKKLSPDWVDISWQAVLSSAEPKRRFCYTGARKVVP